MLVVLSCAEGPVVVSTDWIEAILPAKTGCRIVLRDMPVDVVETVAQVMQRINETKASEDRFPRVRWEHRGDNPNNDEILKSLQHDHPMVRGLSDALPGLKQEHIMRVHELGPVRELGPADDPVDDRGNG